MEGRGLPHLLHIRRLRSSLANHAGRVSLACTGPTWKRMWWRMVGSTHLTRRYISHFLGVSRGGQGHMLREQLAVTSCVFKEMEIPILWAEAKQKKEEKTPPPPRLHTILGDSGALLLVVFPISALFPSTRRRWSSSLFPLNEQSRTDGRWAKELGSSSHCARRLGVIYQSCLTL